MTITGPDRLILVRHAMPAIDPQTPAELWHLGDQGRAAARALRPLLAEPAYYVASTEPKAVETLQEIAGDLSVHTARVRRSTPSAPVERRLRLPGRGPRIRGGRTSRRLGVARGGHRPFRCSRFPPRQTRRGAQQHADHRHTWARPDDLAGQQVLATPRPCAVLGSTALSRHHRSRMHRRHRLPPPPLNSAGLPPSECGRPGARLPQHAVDFVRRIREPLVAGIAERQLHRPPVTQPRDRAAPLADRLRTDAELIGDRVQLGSLVR